MREIYLDNAATTRAYDEVISYINEINDKYYGNPSSLHTKGIESEKLVKQARQRIAASLGVMPGEVLFTSGGTESNNTAIMGYLFANKRKGNHIITSAIEHPSVLEVYKHLSKNGYRVDILEVDSNGKIKLDMLEGLVSDETALVSLIYVNNETGAIQPVEEAAQIIKSRNNSAVFHVDGVQAYGKLQLNPKKSGIDMVSISSHKIHGPKGVGALYIKSGIKVNPLLFGGGQENKLRSGTENVPGISGFGLAAEITFKSLEENNSKLSKLKKFFITQLEEKTDGYLVISPDDGSQYILNTAFSNLKSEVMLHHLEEKGIYVSTGSACSSRKNTASHVLKAMNIDSCYLQGAIRFSFSQFINKEDIEYTVDAIKDIIPRIRYGGKR